MVCLIQTEKKHTKIDVFVSRLTFIFLFLFVGLFPTALYIIHNQQREFIIRSNIDRTERMKALVACFTVFRSLESMTFSWVQSTTSSSSVIKISQSPSIEKEVKEDEEEENRKSLIISSVDCMYV